MWDNLPDVAKLIVLLMGVPVYGYFIVRWWSSAILRSYFEVRQQILGK
jgi:hypothetical protein